MFVAHAGAATALPTSTFNVVTPETFTPGRFKAADEPHLDGIVT